jgi:hypothetical protein
LSSTISHEPYAGGPPLEVVDGAFGAGHFGRWALDALGDPAFDYAPRPACAGDHWHLLGNDRLSATAHSGGYLQIYDWTRGGKILNRWHPESRNYAGGFHWVRVGEATCCTLSAYLPADATQQTRFGVGYVERVTRWRGLRLTERFSMPPGDAPLLHAAIDIVNESAGAMAVQVTAYWAANLHQLTVAPIMTYGSERLYDRWRRRLNRRWRIEATGDPGTGAWHARYVPLRPPRKPRTARALIDAYLPALVILPGAAAPPVLAGAIDPKEFFGEGGVAAPDGLNSAMPPGARTASAYDGMPVVLQWRATLPAGEDCAMACSLRVDHGEGTHATAKPVNRPRATMEFVVPGAPVVARELQWHAYYLQAGSYYSEYFDAHFIDQGSAYSYMQGASGAPRDFALFLLPLIPLRPDLAKDMLRFVLRMQRAKDGGFPYATFGHGVASGGGVHSWSSDLDLFVLWALAEYVGLTRDFAFLSEEIAYYPPEAGARDTVAGHARRALAHLQIHVGHGPNGLFRAGTGDWNDVLLAFSRIPPLTAWRGESALNEGLAAVVLPLVAQVLGARDPFLAVAIAQLTESGQRFAKSMDRLWTGEWLARGFLGYGGKRLGEDRIFLDAQGFPVIAGLLSPERRTRLFQNIEARCVAPQPAGALCLVPPMRGLLLHPGSDTNGGTWAAIDAWLAWAWSHEDPEAAWRFYESTLLAARAEAYPGVWYGVWSGPDSYNAHYHEKPGETFDFNATPMAKYPVMNMNRHAGPLLAALKMAGITAQRDGILIAPRLPFESFELRTPLIGVAYAPGQVEGHYAPQGIDGGPVMLRLRLPRAQPKATWRAVVDGQPCAVAIEGDLGALCLWPSAPGSPMQWRVWAAPVPVETHP